jgi:hypothetical protein
MLADSGLTTWDDRPGHDTLVTHTCTNYWLRVRGTCVRVQRSVVYLSRRCSSVGNLKRQKLCMLWTKGFASSQLADNWSQSNSQPLDLFGRFVHNLKVILLFYFLAMDGLDGRDWATSILLLFAGLVLFVRAGVVGSAPLARSSAPAKK